MSCIIEDQPLKLTSTITDGGSTLAAPLTAAEYQYYNQTNFTDTPTGTWVATILDANAGTIEYDIAADVLKAGTWRVQAFGTSGGLKFPACADSFVVKDKGQVN